jgi:hypothetical protein
LHKRLNLPPSCRPSSVCASVLVDKSLHNQ